jgi:hypothetical protein
MPCCLRFPARRASMSTRWCWPRWNRSPRTLDPPYITSLIARNITAQGAFRLLRIGESVPVRSAGAKIRAPVGKSYRPMERLYFLHRITLLWVSGQMNFND